jgi:hypothetical protein
MRQRTALFKLSLNRSKVRNGLCPLQVLALISVSAAKQQSNILDAFGIDALYHPAPLGGRVIERIIE